MRKETLGPGICVYNLSNEITPSFVNFIEENLGKYFYKSQVVDTSDENKVAFSEARTCTEYMLPKFILNEDDSPSKLVLNSINLFVKDSLNDYISSYNIEPLIDSDWIILRYGNGEKFDWHIDSGVRYPRNVSAVLYLNDEYTGGEIEFEHYGISYKPKRGDLILFGSDFPSKHRVKPVEQGIRYAVVNWWRYETRPLEYV